MEIFCSEAVNDLAGAMLKVQAEISPAVKDRENPLAKARYATLNSVVEASREALLKYGIWLVQYSVPAEPGHLGLVTGYGSALTYARRYSLSTLVGLVVEDDDGEAACGRSRKGLKKLSQGKHTGEADSTSIGDPGNRNGGVVEVESEILNKLPHFDGINYKLIKAPDGRSCVIATGNTSAKKDLLSGSGFRWNPDRKIWWKYAEAA